MMRMLMTFIAGAVVGAVMLFVIVEVTGGWYTYHTLNKGVCDTMMPDGAQIVPHQPNPCHYRVLRWDVFN